MTTPGLLQTLGLRATTGTARSGGPLAGGGTGRGRQPTGPIKPSLADPPDEVRAPPGKPDGNAPFDGTVTDPARRKPPAPLSDEQVRKVLASLPDDPVKRTEIVAGAVSRISEAARRDPIARGLRDWLARKQPFTSDANARRKLDEGIRDLVDKGIKEGLLQLVSGLLGREPVEIDREKRDKDPIKRPGNDTGEHIGKSPEFDLPIDKPPRVRATHFEFLAAPDHVMGGKRMAIRLRTPSTFRPGVAGAAYVAISSRADFEAKSPHRESDVKFDSKGDLSLSIVAPLESGRYVMYVVVGSSREERPVHEFSVTVATPGTQAR